MDINEIGLKKQFQEEVERYNKFQKTVLMMNGKEEVNKQKDFDIRTYAKYVLKEGTIVEKRELLTCLKSKVEMKNKKFTLGKN